MARGELGVRRQDVTGACLDEQVELSLTAESYRRVAKAIEAIDDDASLRRTPAPRSETPTPGALISGARDRRDAHTLTVQGMRRVTARAGAGAASRTPATTDAQRCGGITVSPNSELPTAEADITRRKHAIVETTFADLIDGPLAHRRCCSPRLRPAGRR